MPVARLGQEEVHVRSRAILSLVCLPLVLSSCGSDPNAPNAGCDGNVLVSVTAGATPEFKWWPDCSVYTLVVLEGTGPTKSPQLMRGR
jgi:hypothetical protein